MVFPQGYLVGTSSHIWRSEWENMVSYRKNRRNDWIHYHKLLRAKTRRWIEQTEIMNLPDLSIHWGMNKHVLHDAYEHTTHIRHGQYFYSSLLFSDNHLNETATRVRLTIFVNVRNVNASNCIIAWIKFITLRTTVTNFRCLDDFVDIYTQLIKLKRMSILTEKSIKPLVLLFTSIFNPIR